MLRKRRSLYQLKDGTITTEDLASIQIELAALDRRLRQLEQDEAANVAPSQNSELIPHDYDSPAAQAIFTHILGAELCQFAADGDSAAVERLLTRGVDPNSLDYDERTPLHLACLNGHINVVSVLLQFNAKTKLTDESGLTPLDLAMKEKRDDISELLNAAGSCRGSPFTTTPKHVALCDAESYFSASSMSSGEELHAGRCSSGDDDESSEVQDDRDDDDETTSSGRLSKVPSSASATSGPSRAPGTGGPPEEAMVIIMVGLPGRGKTFVAQNIQRYFAWHGVQSETLAYKSYWKKVTAGLSTSAFDEEDPEEATAALVAKDIRAAIRRTSGLVIVDGTHSTRRRRHCLWQAIDATHCLPTDRIIFCEINNNDEALIAANVQRAFEAAKNPPSTFIKDYYELMKQHERVYQTLSRTHDRETSFIRIDDQQTFHLNRISGFRPTRMVFLLQNLRHSPVTLYFTRPGEYEEMGKRIGGDSALTELGDCYSKALFEFMAGDLGSQPFLVMSSCAKRCTKTIQHFYNMARHSISPAPEVNDYASTTTLEFPNTPPADSSAPLSTPVTMIKKAAHVSCRVGLFPHLDDLNHGDCEGQLMSEVKRTLPNTLLSMEHDWYNVAWPNGESIKQIFTGRLENLIHELQSSMVPVLVCSHRPLIQGFRAYFTSMDDGTVCAPQNAKNIEVPLHAVVKLSFRGARRVAEVIDLTHRTEQIFKRRSGQDLSLGPLPGVEGRSNNSSNNSFSNNSIAT